MAVQRDGRRVTAADIARSLGISRATVGFVLNDTAGQTISAATKERVLAEAQRLGYRPHIAARALASGKSRIVLLVLPDWPIDYSLRQNIDEATQALEEAGYALITYTPHENSRARPLWETLQPDVVMGMLPFAPEQVRAIRDAGVQRIIPDPDAQNLDPYPEDGPRLQLQHLFDLGHRALAFARSSDPRIVDLVDLRAQVAQEKATALGISVLPAVEIEPGGEAGDIVRRWVDDGITGVVAYNDDVAATIIGAALRAGITVPQQLSVIGHDDAPIASMFEPRISSIRMDSSGLGRYLAQLAISALDGTPAPESDLVTAVHLVPRASTGDERG